MRGHLRAGEVHFDHVGAGLGHETGELGPVFSVRPHDGRDQHFAGIRFLQLREIIEILLQGMLRYLLHVLEADKRRSFLGEFGKTRRHLVNEETFWSYGLEDNAAPARVVGLAAHLVTVAHGRRGKTEGVPEMHPEKIDGKVSADHYLFLPSRLS